MIKLSRIFPLAKILRSDFRFLASAIKMPSLSPTMSEGGIVEWHKREGDKIAAGDLICDIQTDKAVVGMEAEEDGILAKIIKPKDSQNITIGETIAILADFDEDWKSVTIPTESAVTKKKPEEKPRTEEKVEKVESVEKAVKKSTEEKIGPAARRLLDEFGLEPKQIDHTGPHNILTKIDVLRHIDESKSKRIPVCDKPTVVATPETKAGADFIDLPLSNMRQTIAKRMKAAKSAIPHFYTSGAAQIDDLIKERRRLKAEKNKAVSINDFVVKASALALRLVPIVNNCLSAEGVIKTNNTVDISVAVASPTGLITPIVFNADKLGIVEIGAAVQALAEKARNNKLQPHEFMGGTFTISNLGMFGIKEFTAIINSPQAAILAVGAGIPELSFDPAHPTQPKSVSSMRFTLCADARVIDDVSASLFISHLKTLLENPHYLLAEDAANSGDNLSRAWGY